MKCPYCGTNRDKVIDSRSSNNSKHIRRRRECLKCRKRFTTYEHVEEMPLMVIKKDSRREPFDRNKILSGLTKACEKRPVSVEQLEKLADAIEMQMQKNFEKEVKASVIGEFAMKQLHAMDQVAYVRFASVYRQFKDINQFMRELKQLLK
ncbi:MAG: transcriptional regulator NrdR [Candidatus Omnitrophica bacterium]|nr:transcriptional regulator NrdR [Candidatus Omnitrophota bacterium]MBU4487734.1 transcriptional regulator NrdR [Candidatus Omnitrophota bacterium]MCG2705274.1 transcriptional regulator NrdR [Candidatus Omnitrophota bacterium]